MSTMIQRLKDFMESEEGKESMRRFAEKLVLEEQIKTSQRERIKGFYKTQEEFDQLMEGVLARHDEDYRDSCYAKGYMPYPSILLQTLFDIAEIDGEECDGVDAFTTEWPANVYEYMGWQFAVTHGQGSVTSIYKNKELIYRD